MGQNSTKFSSHFSEKKGPSTARSLEPKMETIDKILAYAKCVRGIKLQSNNKILISLN